MIFSNEFKTKDDIKFSIKVKINHENNYKGQFFLTKNQKNSITEYKSEIFVNCNSWNLMKLILLNASYHIICTENFEPDSFLHKIWEDFFNWQQPLLPGIQNKERYYEKI